MKGRERKEGKEEKRQKGIGEEDARNSAVR